MCTCLASRSISSHRPHVIMSEDSLIRFGKRQEYEKRVEEWRKEREELLAKQYVRQKRKADAADSDIYASAWMKWLDRNA